MERIDGVDLDGFPISGEIPAGPVPVQIIHNGVGPTTPEELVQFNKDLNNGHHIETARKHGGIMRILHRDGAGWKILVGTAAAIGTGVAVFEITKKLLKTKDKPHK